MTDSLDDLLSIWHQRRLAGDEPGLDELCRDRPDLRDEVAAGINALRWAERACGSVSMRAPSLPGDTLGDGPGGCRPEPNPDSPPGYQILGKLGQGGMGVVYKARQVGLNRDVALKMIIAGLSAGEEERRRLRVEAEVIAGLKLPGVVVVHEIGEYQSRLFVALEYVAGGSLADRLADAPPGPREAAALVEKVARTVEAAHAAGVIHRDLKPANVLLTPEGEPKVTDFGLARRMFDETITGDGSLKGTPAYMSPEQTGLPGAAVGPRADVYSLGVMLYECLTGRVPFKASSLAEILELVRTAEPVGPRQLNPRLPRDLETICLKCLHKEPYRRYATAGELADDIRRFLRREPIRARPVGALERAWSWARRNRAAAALIAVSLAGVVGLVGGGLLYADAWNRAEAARRLGETHSFYAELTAARELGASGRPGRSWSVLAALAELAGRPDAADVREKMRDDAAACILMPDVRFERVVGGKSVARAVAWNPKRPMIALGLRGANLSPVNQVALIDPDRPDDVRTLDFLHVPLWSLAKQSPDHVTALAFSPDGRYLVAGTRGGRIVSWDLDAKVVFGVPTVSHDAVKGQVWRIVFAKDTRRFFVAANETVAVYDVSRKVPLGTRGNHVDTASLVVRDSGEVRLRDGVWHALHPTTAQSERTYPGRGGPVVAAHPNGVSLLCASGPSVSVWSPADPDTVRPMFALPEEAALLSGTSDMAVSPDGSVLLSACASAKTVLAWDLVRGRVFARLPINGGEAGVAFSPDGRRFAVVCDKQTRLYELRRPAAVRHGGFHTGEVHDFALAGDGGCVTVAQERPASLVRRFAPGADLRSVPIRTDALADDDGRRLAAGPGRRVAAYHPYNPAATLDAFPDAQGTPDNLGKGKVNEAAWGHDGRLWWGSGNTLFRHDFASRKTTAVWVNRSGTTYYGADGVESVAVGRTRVVLGGQEGVARVRPLDHGEEKVIDGERLAQSPLVHVALSPDESEAAVASADGGLWVIDAATGAAVVKVPVSDEPINALAWGAKGHVAVAYADGRVRLSTRGGDTLRPWLTLPAGRRVRRLLFADGGKTLALLREGDRAVTFIDIDALGGELKSMGLEAR